MRSGALGNAGLDGTLKMKCSAYLTAVVVFDSTATSYKLHYVLM